MANDIVIRGELRKGRKVLVMVHGRGATAADILSLAVYLPVKEFTLVAPQAPDQTWYPFSFLAAVPQNEPYLSTALKTLDDVVEKVAAAGIVATDVYFLGFSQGACLTLEYCTRNARKWGGVIAFTGGLIGDVLDGERYSGDFEGTPVYIGTSDPDPHVPVERVYESEAVLRRLGAKVTVEVIKGMGHTIVQKELDQAIMILSGTR